MDGDIEKKLFEVEVSGYYYVMAVNASEAERITRRTISRYDLTFDGVENPTSHYGAGDAIPFNSDDKRTVGEIVAEIREKEKKKKYLERHHQDIPFSNFVSVPGSIKEES